MSEAEARGQDQRQAGEAHTPSLPEMMTAFADAGVRALALRSPQGMVGTASTTASRTFEILIRPAHVEAALAVLERMSWRYSWVRTGLMRLLPSAYYWWDGGTAITVGWGSSAAPLPARALAGLTDALWEEASEGPAGWREARPSALLVHLATQACRPGVGREDDWDRFLNCRAMVDDLAAAHAVAKRAGVTAALRRALSAAEAGTGRPGRGPLYDGLKGLIWRIAIGLQAHARSGRIRRMLAGTPVLGDTAIRCRVRGIETIAGPGVFVPTPDADLFVEIATQLLDGRRDARVVEVGTGNGAIALAIAHEMVGAEIHATELSGEAVRSAKANARRLRLERVRFYRGSVLDPLPTDLDGRVDLIIANLPFYPARDYASIGSVPRGTVQGTDDDGLGLLRQLARDSASLLRPTGALLVQLFAWQWEILSRDLIALGYRPGPTRRAGPFAICQAFLDKAPARDAGPPVDDSR